jgi:hypothetical protein
VQWLDTQIGKRVARETVYKHRDHIAHPKDRVVTAVARRQAQGSLPQVSSDEQFLNAIQSIALRKAMEDPDQVTISHGLKATQIKQQAKDRTSAVIIAIQNIITQGRIVPDIEGEVRDVTEE